MKEFEIFRAGSWTSDKGITKNYTEDDLQKIVDNYNSEDPAPIVIGHPETNAPAYGWIDSIKKVADRLIAVPKQLNEKFVDLVKNGSFKKRSISLSPDFKLNHVGFLGAAAPAVEGLKEIQFSNSAELDNYSADVVDPLNDDDDDDDEVDDVVEPVIVPEEKPELKVSLDQQAESLKNFQASVKELTDILSNVRQNFSQLTDDELKKIHTRINDLQFSMQVNDFELRLNEKLAYGSVTPAMKTKLMNVVSFLQKQNFSGSEFSFDKYIIDVKQHLLDFVESIPKIIYYENFVEKPLDTKVNDNEFEDLAYRQAGVELDQDSLQIHKKALAYMKAHEGVEYIEAINIISKQ